MARVVIRGQRPCPQVESTKTKIDIRSNQSANQESPLRTLSESSGGHYGSSALFFCSKKTSTQKTNCKARKRGERDCDSGESKKRRQMTEKGMQRGSNSVSFRTRGPAALVFITIISLLFFNVIAEASNNSQVGCSKTCVAENCNSIGIRYGKYCGVGWSGCPGEKPCDDLDACCKIHDECVEKKGLTDVKCHEKFKKCIKKVQKSGKVGFSRDCPYDTAVPTMVQGMDLAIMFSHFGNSKVEL